MAAPKNVVITAIATATNNTTTAAATGTTATTTTTIINNKIAAVTTTIRQWCKKGYRVSRKLTDLFRIYRRRKARNMLLSTNFRPHNIA